MTIQFLFLQQKKPSAKLLRQRPRLRTLPFLFVIVVTVATSQLLVSHAFSIHRGIQRGSSKFSVASSFKNSVSSCISSSRPCSGSGIFRVNLPLYASIKSTNTNTNTAKSKRRKQKHLRKKKKQAHRRQTLSDRRVDLYRKTNSIVI